jgi:lipopolysaccharide transport system ATP-binding protein
MGPAISVRDLSKQYFIGSGSYTGAGLRMTETLTGLFRHPVKTVRGAMGAKESFWALQDINFEVNTGESMGIIGRNGAGKSTLLKVLSQITYPTKGEVVLRGRVGSLLEVGTGFHPELTGRENVFLNGAILGMTRKEIRSKFDEIVKFAEVERFLDTPVKRYSSGMYLRLAFSVAAHLESEILIADEVLAVGDQQFQAKCLGKMREVYRQGRTVIFVSHNMHAVRSLCESAILLRQGQIAATGSANEVIDQYARSLESRNVDFPVELKDLTVEDLAIVQNGSDTTLIDGARPFDIVLRFRLPRDIDKLRMGIYVNNRLGDELVRSMFSDWDMSRESLPAGSYVARLTFPEKLLTSGNFSITLGAKRQGSIDLLAGTKVERTINVATPVDFNHGGPVDPYQAEFILNRTWQLDRR